MANIQTDEARPPAADEGNFYNMVRVWFMVSETHTIILKYKYGNNITITIEKKILYGTPVVQLGPKNFPQKVWP